MALNFKKFKAEFENTPVQPFQNTVSKKPLVSVCIQTYNHENYIKKCLDSVLTQITNFDFEILLGEDFSSDGTREICINYAKEHPNKIKLFLHHRENNIRINGTPTGRFNFLYNLFTSKGKYIALCEGDDYWTDPHKLQKQVDFLENNPIYTIVGHSSKVLTKSGQLLNDSVEDFGTINKQTFFGKLPFRTNTFLFKRKEITNELAKLNQSKYLSGDRIIMAICLLKGEAYKLKEHMSVYRHHAAGISKTTKYLNVLNNEIALFNYLNIYTKGEYHKTLTNSIFTANGKIGKELYNQKKYTQWFKTVINTARYIQTKIDLKIYIKELLLRL